MTGLSNPRRGRWAEAIDAPVPAIASSRVALAAGAALALHLAVMSVGPLAARADSPSAPPRSMTVRTVATVTPAAPVAPTTATTPEARAVQQPVPSDQGVPLVPPVPAAPAVPRAADKPAEPTPGTRSARETAEPSPSLPAMPATPSAPIAEAGPPVPPSSVSAALPAATQYLMAARLDPGPQPIGDIEPVYPESAHLQEGTVVLRVLISETGRVDNVAVVRSNPPGFFEAAAIEAFSKAEFTPGKAAGTPVKSQITVEVHFLPVNRGRISGRGY